MTTSPILGPFGVSRSKSAEDSQEYNLFLEAIDAKDGAAPAYLLMAPGVDRLITTGPGPIRGMQPMGGLLYVVSGPQVWAVTPSLQASLLGSISTGTGPVSIINNGSQLAIFDGYTGYLTSGGLVGGGGTPLTGGSIGAAGLNYAVGDNITLAQTGGVQEATAILLVTSVDPSGAVTAFSIAQPGLFSTQPTSFSQNTTTGNGSGFELISPTYGSAVSLTNINLPFSGGPVSASYQDGFGIVNDSGTNAWYQSDLDDLSSWQALNFANANSQPDNVVALADIIREVWVFKQDNIEIWINAGLPGFTFQRLQGVFIEFGCAAAASIARAGESLLWLSRNEQGQGVVRMSDGYTPRRVSTHALEFQIAKYGMVADAIGYAYQQEGHLFYVLTFPTGNATWALDLTSTQNLGYPCWHRRAEWLDGKWNRHWGNAYATFPATGSQYTPRGVTTSSEIATSGALLGVPSTFTDALFSAWVFLPDDGSPHGFYFSNQATETGGDNGGFQVGIFNDQTSSPQIVVNAYDVNGVAIVEAAYDLAGWSEWTWIAVSIDTPTQTLQVYANQGGGDRALTPTSIAWTSSNPIYNAPAQSWHVLPGSH